MPAMRRGTIVEDSKEQARAGNTRADEHAHAAGERSQAAAGGGGLDAPPSNTASNNSIPPPEDLFLPPSLGSR